MDLDLKESIDFDFFDDNPQSQNKDAAPDASSSKPPMHPHNTKVLPKTENVGNSDKIFIDSGRRSEPSSGSDSSRDSSSSESSSNSDNDSKSLSKHKIDTVKSQHILSKSSSSVSSIRSSLSSSSLLSDSERSNSHTNSHSKSKRSDKAKKTTSSSSGSDSEDRPTNPLAKFDKQIFHQKKKPQHQKAESSSSVYSGSEDMEPKKSTLCDDNGDSTGASQKRNKRQAWDEVKVIRDKEKRSKSAKPTETISKGRPKTAARMRNTSSYSNRLPRSRSDSGTLSDSDITDVSPIDTPRNDAYGKYKDKRESSRMTSAGDCHPGKLQFRSITDVGQKNPAPDQDYDPDKITGLDLNILMKAVGELEKQNRVQANSRRVMFAPSALKSIEKDNYTFDKSQTRDIERENHRLLKEIVRQVNSGDRRTHFFRPPSSYKLTPSAVNRERDIQRIERENLALLKRLQEVKPTKTICRDHQLRAYESTIYLGVPIAALHHKPTRRNMHNYTIDDSDTSVGGRSRSASSIASVGSSVRSVGSSRSSRPSSASRPPSSITKRIDSRPAWSDRW